MKTITLLCILTVLTVLPGCDNTPVERPKNPEELRAELRAQEQSNPLDYLSAVNATMKHNQTREEGLFHEAEYDGWLVEGQIKNTATLARFKDVIVTVQLLSHTKTVIESKDYVIYEFFESNRLKNFTIKMYPPDATKEFNVFVKGATPVN